MDMTQHTELAKRRWLSSKAFEIELTRPPGFDFTAGQTVCFHYRGIERYYSIVSAPDEPGITLCVRNIKAGLFSPILAEAAIGTGFEISGPHGYFTFKASRQAPVFVATGSGIAPFVSMGRAGITGFILLHGTRSAEELYYEAFFRRIADGYIPCISEPATKDRLPEDAHPGRVTDYIGKVLPQRAYDFYLCGRGEMIRDVTLLVDDHFPGSRVYQEVYFQDYAPS